MSAAIFFARFGSPNALGLAGVGSIEVHLTPERGKLQNERAGIARCLPVNFRPSIRHLILHMLSNAQISETLCLACGLCCNGVLFKDVELQRGDNAGKLKSLGLPVAARRSVRCVIRFPQPCAALCPDCHCRVYPDRPARCRDFECALFKAVAAGKMETSAALRIISQARQRADKVVRLLRRLGDMEEHVALSVRFRRLKRRVEAEAIDEVTAELYGQLTLAVHDLNLLLGTAFYPQ